MKVVRFLKRSYINASIVEPGETVLMADDALIGPHMVDVRAESEAAARGETLPEPVPEVHPQAVFRADLAHDVQASGAVPVFPQPEPHVDPVPAETVSPWAWKEPGSMEHPATEPHVEPPAKG